MLVCMHCVHTCNDVKRIPLLFLLMSVDVETVQLEERVVDVERIQVMQELVDVERIIVQEVQVIICAYTHVCLRARVFFSPIY